MILRLSLICGLTALSFTATSPRADAADLQPRSAQAYDKYTDEMARDFVARAQRNSGTRRCDGMITARAGSGDGILNVPDGLIHHWLGLAFVRGATLKDVERVARDYAAYRERVRKLARKYFPTDAAIKMLLKPLGLPALASRLIVPPVAAATRYLVLR